MQNFHPNIKRKLGIFKKRPYFLKNKDWYYIEKDVIGYDVYSITELGKSIPEVYKSYLEFYNIKTEDIFPNGGTDVNSEFVLYATKRIRKNLKEKGYLEKDIDKYIYEFVHIEDLMSIKDKHEAEKQFSELEKEFNEYYQKNKLDKHKSSNNLELNNYNDESKDNFNNLEQNDYFNTELKSSNTIINKIKNKKKIELKNISYCKYKKFVIFIK